MLVVENKEGVNPKDYFPDSKYIIIYAFTVGTRHYFRFDDPLSTGYHRALQTLVYYKEVDMNIDREFLKVHTEAIDNLFNKTSMVVDDLLEIKKLNDHLKQRLALPKEPELMYKLASVVFFDQFENPEVYEFKYGEAKIRSWKKTTIKDFFLQMPLMELIPYLKFAGENIELFSRMASSHTTEYLESLSRLLSDAQKMTLNDRLNLSPAA